MKILFSPSESKSDISTHLPLSSFKLDSIFKDKQFEFEKENYTLYDKRNDILKTLSTKIMTANNDILRDIFGSDEIDKYKVDFFKNPTQKAILRYTGIAYKALDYQTLNKKAQDFIDKNVMIFSNIFGVVFADDKIPLYKLKQGKTIDNINIPKYYKTYFSQALDIFLKDEEIIDLRAEFYTKFYSVKNNFYTFKFVKNGKTINHYSKHYRGLFLRDLAILSQNKNININDFLSYVDKNFVIIQTQKDKNKTTIVVEIKE